MMDRIWAPWRQAYIRPKSKKSGCFFCQYLKQNKDAKNFVLKRTASNFAVLNLYPYTNGHVLIAPIRHVATFAKLNDKEKLGLLTLAEEVQAALSKSLK